MSLLIHARIKIKSLSEGDTKITLNKTADKIVKNKAQ